MTSPCDAGHFGPRLVVHLQESYGAKVYYNTMVPIERGPHAGRLMKYGVVSTCALRADLRHWHWVYLAGRMHKPVCFLAGAEHAGFRDDIAMNVRAGLHAALLMLPGRFEEQALYEKIASLSYAGDIRMGVGEHPSKVRNMVAPNIEQFRRWYSRPLASLCRGGLVQQGTLGATLEQDTACESRRFLAERLPSTLQASLAQQHTPSSPSPSAVNMAMRAIVYRSSATQTVKGVVTGGLVRSAAYAFRKISRAQRDFRQGSHPK